MDTKNQKDQTLVILMAHGSRHEEGSRQAEALMTKISEACPHKVEKAYLELKEPDLKNVVRCYANEVSKIFILPLLIFRGGHALRDIPEILEECNEEFPGLTIRQGPVLEPKGEILGFWEEFGKNWIEKNPHGQVLLLGRGAKDVEAKEAFNQIEQQLKKNIETSISCAFTGIQEPDLTSALGCLKKENPLLIFPCLLFDGVLLEKSRKLTEGWEVTWAPTLSNSPTLVHQVLGVIENRVEDF